MLRWAWSFYVGMTGVSGAAIGWHVATWAKGYKICENLPLTSGEKGELW